jgi:hypothetical protein
MCTLIKSKGNSKVDLDFYKIEVWSEEQQRYLSPYRDFAPEYVKQITAPGDTTAGINKGKAGSGFFHFFTTLERAIRCAKFLVDKSKALESPNPKFKHIRVIRCTVPKNTFIVYGDSEDAAASRAIFHDKAVYEPGRA